MFAYLTPKIFFIDMHFGLHTKAARDPVVVFPQLEHTPLPPHDFRPLKSETIF